MATLRTPIEEMGTHSAGPAGLDAVFERLAARLGESARAAHVFGEAVERDGVTVVPVATARWGVGGGSGPKKGEGMGTGGGGGATVKPIGYIEIRAGSSRFRPLWDAKTVLSGVAMAAALLAFALKRR
jgi:uncharacterized spore protein YtfJ